MTEYDRSRHPETEQAAQPTDKQDYSISPAPQPKEWICAASKSEGGEDFEARRFASEDEAYAWLETQDGKHCWITPNPVRAGVGKACDADVIRAPWQLVDVDPPADTERVAREIFEAFGRCGKLNFSGRGHQVLLRVAPDVDRLRLARYVQSEWKVDKGVGQDVSRLTRAVGFRNPRTGEVAETLEEGEGEVTAAVLELLTADWVPPAEIEIRGWDPGPADAADLAAMPPGGRRVWDSENSDRSHRLFAFVKECLKAGLSPERTCRLAIEMPDSKLADRDSAYWATTYASAVGHLETERVDAELLANLPERCAEDPGLAFEAEALQAAARLSQAERMRLRGRLKSMAGVSVTAWDAAVKDARQELIEEDAPSGPPDELLMRVVSSGKLCGWVTPAGQWLKEHEVLSYLGEHLKNERWAKAARTAAIDKPWELVSLPFQPKLLSGRRYNISRTKFRYPRVIG